MRRGVRVRLVVLVAAVVAALSALAWHLVERDGSLVPSPPWLSAVVLGAIATAVAWFGWPVRRYLAGRATKPLNPLRAARAVVLAQAATLTGAAVLGWYAGQLAVVLRGLELVAYQRRVWPLAVMLLAALLVIVAGLLAQGWCRLDPPDDDRDDPGVA